MQSVALSTDRFRLVPADVAYADQYVEACSDPEVTRWCVSVPHPFSHEDAVSYLGTISPGAWDEGRAAWTILDGDTLVGDIAFSGPAITPGSRPELGLWIAAPYRGTGAAEEAARTAIDWAFEQGASAILWRCLIDGEPNWASARVAWKLGFTFEGVSRAAIARDDRAYDALSATLLAGEDMSPAAAWFGPQDSRPPVPSPRDPEALVRQFHETYRLPIHSVPDADRERIHLRMSLVAEEFIELVTAAYGKEAGEHASRGWEAARAADDHTRDTVEIADALGDLIYVVYGMALELGIPLPDVLREIQDSNLSKLGGDGQPIYREDGKVLKGPNYFRPDIAKVLRRFQ